MVIIFVGNLSSKYGGPGKNDQRSILKSHVILGCSRTRDFLRFYRHSTSIGCWPNVVEWSVYVPSRENGLSLWLLGSWVSSQSWTPVHCLNQTKRFRRSVKRRTAHFTGKARSKIAAVFHGRKSFCESHTRMHPMLTVNRNNTTTVLITDDRWYSELEGFE